MAAMGGNDQPTSEPQPFVVPQGPKPSWMQSGESDLVSAESLREKLRNTTEVNLVGIPLNRAVLDLTEQLHTSIVFDEGAIADSGMSVEESISLQAGSMPISEALQLVLSPKNLTYSVKANHILVTSEDAEKIDSLLRLGLRSPFERRCSEFDLCHRKECWRIVGIARCAIPFR